MQCWRCHERVEGPVCVGCGVVQPPPAKVDPFALLGVPRRYHLDRAATKERYLALQRATHPDRHAARPAVERRMALQWTAALNEARRILEDDRQRARWLATGRALPSERGGPKLDGSFLAEMFEWSEAEDAAPGSVRSEAEARAAALVAELDATFSAWESGAGTLDAVEERLARLNYVERFCAKGERDAEHRD
jgi:molecular chaperone HscB